MNIKDIIMNPYTKFELLLQKVQIGTCVWNLALTLVDNKWTPIFVDHGMTT